MMRLHIAKREIRSCMSDHLFNRGNTPEEVTGLAKLREALALLDEALFAFGQAEMGGRIRRTQRVLEPADG